MTDDSRRYDRAVMRLAGGLLGAVFLSLTPAGVSGGWALGAAFAEDRIRG